MNKKFFTKNGQMMKATDVGIGYLGQTELAWVESLKEALSNHVTPIAPEYSVRALSVNFEEDSYTGVLTYIHKGAKNLFRFNSLTTSGLPEALK
jgi:hypothetical protein